VLVVVAHAQRGQKDHTIYPFTLGDTERMAAVLDPETDEVVIAGKELLRLSRDKTERLKAELGYEGPDLRWDE